ncbi:MAG: proline--tRNA ligase [Candidatus Omnitrophica bacterium]|nr:proline--tRNA ligase [Candidatus Omnitrophota bacterium]
MFWSKTFIPTLRHIPQEAESISHQLMLRAGLVRMLISGVYMYLPLGLKVLSNIERIIREEMNKCGAVEVLLSALQPLELWQKSGRDEMMGEVMIRFTDRKGRKLCLGPTHEEVVTFLVKGHISSYRQLPVVLYQIQTKFRDEIRPRFGLVRACEFIMKDAYSFDKDENGLEKNYQKMFCAYKRIFKRCGLNFYIIEADPGVMGGDVSHEFMVPAKAGEDAILRCPKCNYIKIFKEETNLLSCPKCTEGLEKINTLEIGHIFKLKTKYSLSLGAYFLDRDGKQKPIVMGCYGIGVSRLISAIIEQNYDAEGIVWPKEISPFKVIIIPLNTREKLIMQTAKDIYEHLSKSSVEVILDDRDEQAGVKFKDADLLGICLQIVIGKELLNRNNIELRWRKDKKILKIKKSQAISYIKRIIDE